MKQSPLHKQRCTISRTFGAERILHGRAPAAVRIWPMGGHRSVKAATRNKGVNKESFGESRRGGGLVQCSTVQYGSTVQYR